MCVNASASVAIWQQSCAILMNSETLVPHEKVYVCVLVVRVCVYVCMHTECVCEVIV